MLRKILGAVVGYIVMFIIVFATFSGAYLGMGTERTFLPGSYDVTTLWIVVSFVLGLIAAIVGGFVASLIGRGGAVKILAGIVLVLGLLTVIFVAVSPKPADARTPEVSNMEAMSKAQQPLWVAILNPVIGIIGVMIGGGLKKHDEV